MDIREQLCFMEDREAQEPNRVPEWVHAEHLEMNVPLKELWTYSDSLDVKKSNNIIISVLRNVRGFRKMKRKHVIICHSAEAMNRKADALMERGYQVEREYGVQPVQAICFPTYKVKFWK